MSNPSNGDSPRDEELRHLLDDAVSDVHAEGGPDAIRAKARRSTGHRWIPVTLTAAAATVLVIGGAVWLAQQQRQQPPAAGPVAPTEEPTAQTSPSGEPSDEPSDGPTAEPQPPRTAEVSVYYLGETAAGTRLFSETHRVPGATESDVQVAVEEVLTRQPVDPDYANVFRDLGVSATATNVDGAVTLDLSAPLSRPAGMDDQRAQLALQSLVWTATGPDAKSVTFTVGGAKAYEVLGLDTAQPLRRVSADSILAPVSIDTPGHGQVVDSTFEVKGRAAAFEANVVWELMQGDRVVRNGFTTARECCTLAPYSFTVKAKPGDYTLVVHDEDASGGEGIGENRDTKQITVR